MNSLSGRDPQWSKASKVRSTVFLKQRIISLILVQVKLSHVRGLIPGKSRTRTTWTSVSTPTASVFNGKHIGFFLELGKNVKILRRLKIWLVKLLQGAQMYSLTVNPSFVPRFAASSASSSSYRWPRLCSSIGFRVKTESRVRRFGLRIHAYDSSKSDTPNGNGDSKPPNGSLVVV